MLLIVAVILLSVSLPVFNTMCVDTLAWLQVSSRTPNQLTGSLNYTVR
jgi:hypothetical protein